MRSVADRRTGLEWLLRAGALAVLVVALVRAILAGTGDANAPLQVRAEQALDLRRRDSLTALARAGTPVRWSGTVAPIATTSEPVRDPSSRTRLLVASDAAITIDDSLGAIDSLAQGGALTTAGLAGAVRVRAQETATAPTEARTIARTAAAPGRVLVLGRVGWEAKFTVATLEEAGWTVDTRLAISDTLRITQGSTAEPAVSTHSAVVVLDSALGAQGAAIARFVRAGGGLVLAGDGANALPLLVPRGPDAVRVETRVETVVDTRVDARAEAPVIAARRVGAGRVVQLREAETWRWRMQGEQNAVVAHRTFWNDLVAMVASAPPDTATRANAPLDEAPLASLIQQLGPPVPDAPASSSDHRPIPAWLGALALLLLLAEWASRRARGAA